MESIRREQDEAEVAECSFRPRINSKSARMVEQRQQILRVRNVLQAAALGSWRRALVSQGMRRAFF